jgi:hypothetical protein
MNVFKEIIEVKNCRKYLKRAYLLNLSIDKQLVMALADLGLLEIYEFSKFSAVAKDTFKIQIEETLQITGVIHDEQVFITIAKTSLNLIAEIEILMNDWYLQKMKVNKQASVY